MRIHLPGGTARGKWLFCANRVTWDFGEDTQFECPVQSTWGRHLAPAVQRPSWKNDGVHHLQMNNTYLPPFTGLGLCRIHAPAQRLHWYQTLGSSMKVTWENAFCQDKFQCGHHQQGDLMEVPTASHFHPCGGASRPDTPVSTCQLSQWGHGRSITSLVPFPISAQRHFW